MEGFVKTRLGAQIGSVGACRLYAAFVQDMIRTLDASGLPLCVYYDVQSLNRAVWMQLLPLSRFVESRSFTATPAIQKNVFSIFEKQRVRILHQWLGSHRDYYPQALGDVGARMEAAMLHALNERGYAKVLLLGSDIPDFPLRHICHAAESLSEYDVVINPTADGGYCLLGFRKECFCSEIFQSMQWSTPSVYNDTMSWLMRAGYSVLELPAWADIDTYADMQCFCERQRLGDVEGARLQSYDVARELLHLGK